MAGCQGAASTGRAVGIQRGATARATLPLQLLPCCSSAGSLIETLSLSKPPAAHTTVPHYPPQLLQRLPRAKAQAGVVGIHAD